MNNYSERHGLFSMHELITTDLESAKEFYGDLLGWIFTGTKTIYGNPFCVIKDPRGIGLNLITYEDDGRKNE